MRETHNIKLKLLLAVAGVAKSVYYYWVQHMDDRPDRDQPLLDAIRQIIEDHKGRLGYRRMTTALNQNGWAVNHKRVRRIMRENNLSCRKFNRKSRRFITYRGKVGTVAKNRLNRRFMTDRPYQKWLTDITEFKIPSTGERLYFSPIMDVYNREIIAWKFSASPTYDIVHDPLTEALEKRPALPYRLTVHSDQGWHYQMKQWGNKLKQYNAFQSMSRKGNCLDNSPMENFFGIMKQEMFHGETFESYEALAAEIEAYIEYYNHTRISLKLDGMAPVAYRAHTHPEVA